MLWFLGLPCVYLSASVHGLAISDYASGFVAAVGHCRMQ